YDSTYDGSGKTTRNENLQASITARIMEVLPNGNLMIEGRRNVKVNNEDQEIVLEGTVRPRDVSANNVVNSIHIADARISYTGKGVVSDRQRPGWLMTLLEKVWPF
ncbi:MAG TPA: flagellar basal body L-ring protein FlgH, partial [Geobacterales bacterium]|nr:flagellar basal body L-ring protein FlgH [Geobacterales bacterium]